MSELKQITSRLHAMRARRWQILDAVKRCGEDRGAQLEREAAQLNREIEEAEVAFDSAAERATPGAVRQFDASCAGNGAAMMEHRRREQEEQAERERAICRALQRGHE